jgi:hypothetical protein
MMAKVRIIDKDIVKQQALDMFAKMNIDDVNFARLMAQVKKHGDDAERALINGDPAAAVVSMQHKYSSAIIAAEARKLEKEQTAFAKLTKRWSARVVPNTDPEYTPYIHDIMIRTGNRVRRSVEDIQDQIAGNGTGTLDKFIENKANMLREIPVWDQLYDPTWRKAIDEMSVEEFRNVHDSLKALTWNARDEMKVTIAGEKMDLKELKDRMIAGLDRGKPIHLDPDGKRVGSIPGMSVLKTYMVQGLNLETIFNRFDHFNSKGDWNMVLRDLIDGANQKDAWEKEYAKKISEIKDDRDLNRTVSNPIFRDPSSKNLWTFTRQHLLAVMLNTGNESNLRKLAGGYGLEPEQVMNWVHSVANKEDWEFVQKVWDMFKDIKSKSDTMYRSLTGGVPAENVRIRPIDTTWGQYKGGYYPIIHHEIFANSTTKAPEQLMHPEYYKATTPAGYTKSRTGDVRPLSLSIDNMPGRINQMLHDIALRPAVINASKIFYDNSILDAIKFNYGPEYARELKPYLSAVANSANMRTDAPTALNRVSEFMRQNLISNLIAFNPGTVLKHGPSALITSMREVGAKNFLNAARSMFSIDEATGESNWQFAINNSLELQRRDRNWQESIYGATNTLTQGQGYGALRQKIMEWGSKPVAISDMLSATPTWLAKYKEQIEAGEDHGTAVSEADRAVRRAHGSTAITNRSAMQRNISPWLTSVYNFFSDIMNRQIETVWKAGETLDLAKESGWGEASKAIPALTASVFAYALWPALVEELVSPTPEDKKHKESWGWWATKGIAHTLASGFVGVRDLASAFTSGRDPQSGMVGTAYKEIADVYRDLGKDQPWSREHAGKTVQDGMTMIGLLSGIPLGQAGKATHFGIDVKSGLEKPKGPWAWGVGLRYGTTKNHSQTVNQYIGGR